ncbi:MAG: BatD family protein [Flavobacteriaceae bacterium]|jgi:hypothetical protein|nr:BatD family protein [Flavobacteriaceae bacterium]
MRTLRYYILFIAFVCAQVAVAQVSFEATVKKDSVPLNKHIEVSFTMNQDSEDFTPPSFKNFRVVKGPSTSIAHSWIAGKRGLQKTYSYQLLAKEQGKHLIGSACIVFEGQTYQTKPISVFIVEPTPIAKVLKKKALEHTHYIVETPNTTPYVNEMVILNYKIITNIPLRSIKEQVTEGSQRIFEVPNSFDDSTFYHKTKYQGKETYYVNTVRNIFAYDKAGHKTVPPETIIIETLTQEIDKDYLGKYDKTFSEVLDETEYSTQELIFKVKDLPEKNKPKQFLNAVGTFDLNVVPTVLQIKKGETLDVKVQVSGEGNLYLLEMPLLTTTMQETPKPTEEEQIDVVENRIVGTRTNTYTFIPQETGNFIINPIEFSYFDPKIKKYNTIRTEGITIQVTD